MSRLSEKLRLSHLLARPTKYLSLKLSQLSLSTLHLCKSLARALASKALALFTMDDSYFTSSVDDDPWDLDNRYRYRPQRRLLDEEDDADNAIDKVYLVPYRYVGFHYLLSLLFVYLLVWLPRKQRKRREKDPLAFSLKQGKVKF